MELCESIAAGGGLGATAAELSLGLRRSEIGGLSMIIAFLHSRPLLESVLVAHLGQRR